MTPERRAEIQDCMMAMTSSPSREGQMLKDLLTEIDRMARSPQGSAMKEEDLAWIEAKSAAGDYANDEEIDKLVTEVRRQRSLPVISTCGDCRWYSIVGRDTVCTYQGASTPIKGNESPPDWCPKRSAP